MVSWHGRITGEKINNRTKQHAAHLLTHHLSHHVLLYTNTIVFVLVKRSFCCFWSAKINWRLFYCSLSSWHKNTSKETRARFAEEDLLKCQAVKRWNYVRSWWLHDFTGQDPGGHTLKPATKQIVSHIFTHNKAHLLRMAPVSQKGQKRCIIGCHCLQCP
jgi:hypothetical protein